jgi:hypothetical protein
MTVIGGARPGAALDRGVGIRALAGLQPHPAHREVGAISEASHQSW